MHNFVIIKFYFILQRPVPENMDDFDLTSYLLETSEPRPDERKDSVESLKTDEIPSSNETVAEEMAEDKDEEAASNTQDSQESQGDRPSLRLVSTYGGVNPTAIRSNDDDLFCGLPVQDTYGKIPWSNI